jgi:hypothetical protein
MSRFNWKRTPARGEISSGIQQRGLVDTALDEVLLRLEDGGKPSLTEHGKVILCAVLNDWAERQKKADAEDLKRVKAEARSGPGPDRELTLLDGTVYRKVGYSGMNEKQTWDELERVGRERNEAWGTLDKARRMVSSLLSAMSANQKAEKETIAGALQDIALLLSHEPESRTPV